MRYGANFTTAYNKDHGGIVFSYRHAIMKKFSLNIRQREQNMSKIFFPSKNIKDKKAKPCTLKVPKFVVKVAIFLTACASDGASVSE